MGDLYTHYSVVVDLPNVTVRRLDLQFDADQITTGNNKAQADQAIEAINLVLQREPFSLGAQLLAYREEIDIEVVEPSLTNNPKVCPTSQQSTHRSKTSQPCVRP